MSIEGVGGERVLGWDVLRGLCALTVASYHLLYWLQVAELPALATYGVYMFFVLSGASLAYNYDATRMATPRQVGGFLFARWMRLAPLYLLLCPLWAFMLAVHNGYWMSHIPQRFALNATFAFGLWDPVTWALLVGGWSLGIEFVYYLFFPFITRMLVNLRRVVLLFVVLAALQWVWIYLTVGKGGWQDSVVAYHQVPAFAAYFVGGCIIGELRRRGSPHWPFIAGLAAWGGMAALLFALMPAQAGEELLGVTGLLLFAACFAVTYVSGQVDVRGELRETAAWLGDITYGCYLLHPILLWGALWFVVPGMLEVPLRQRVAMYIGVLCATCLLATLSERWFERPIRKWSRKWWGPRPHPTKGTASA